MQNQQIVAKIYQLEQELKKIKIQIQKKPTDKSGNLWAKINFLDGQIEEVKRGTFDFDVESFVGKQDVASWK